MHVLGVVLEAAFIVIVMVGVAIMLGEILIRLANWLTDEDDDDFWSGGGNGN